jgi:hypothetical protein
VPINLSELGIEPGGAEPAEEPGFLESVGGGLLTGAYEDPLVRPIMQLFGVDDATVSAVEDRVAGSGLADAFQTIGKYGSLFAPGLGAWSLGRAGARLAMGAASPSVRAFRAAVAAEKVLAPPAALRAAEVIGGSLGLGGEETLRGLAEGDTIDSALLRGAQAAAIGAGAETALIGVGKMLPGGKAVDPTKVVERGLPPLKGEAKRTMAKLEKRETNLMQDVLQLRMQGYASEVWVGKEVARARAAVGERAAAKAKRMPRSERAFAQTGVERRALKAEQRVFKQAEKLRGKQRELVEVGLAKKKVRALPGQRPVESSYLREVPLSGQPIMFMGYQVLSGDVRQLVQRMRLRMLKSPETAARQSGHSATLLTDLADDWSRLTEVMGRPIDKLINKSYRELKKGLKAQGYKTSGKGWLNPVRDAWEPELGGSIAGVQAKFGDDVAEVWTQLMRAKEVAYDSVVAVGGLPKMTPMIKRQMGVSEHFPQRVMFERHSPEEAVERIIAAGKARGVEISKGDAMHIYTQTVEGRMSGGFPKMGNIDFERRLAGTSAQKSIAGLEMMDAEDALRLYFHEMVQKQSFSQIFGPHGEVKDILARAATAEGASPAIINTLTDHFFGFKYTDQAMRKLAKPAANLQILTKMALGVIPNMSQTINTIMFANSANTIRGMGNFLKKEERGHVMEALGHLDGTFEVMRRMWSGGTGQTFSDRAADIFLKGIGFTPVEMFNRYLGGSASMAFARKTTRQAINGHLRGNNLGLARRRMRDLGLDLGAIARRGHMTEAELQTAVLKGARVTQFIPGPTRLPTWWQTPTGRVLFQFKSFAFNQAKFIRDSVVQEAAHGNVKPLLYFLSIYPLAGEMVNDTLAVIKDRDRDSNGAWRFVENYSAVGGFGLAWNAAMALRFGRGVDFLLGPTVSDMMSLAETLANVDRSTAFVRDIQRQPSYQMGRFLVGMADEATDELDELLTSSGSAGGAPEATPWDELFQQIRK